MSVVANLSSRGLRTAVLPDRSTLGFDFTDIRDTADVLRDEEALALVRFMAFSAQPFQRWVVHYVLWATDQHARALSRTEVDGSPSPALIHLQQAGFVCVHDWGIDHRALRDQAEKALASSAAKGSAVRQIGDDAHLPALRPLLENATVSSMLRGYLGGRVRYDGITVLRLTNELTSTKDYASARWHHDRCGRRLKLFIFLHDVDEETRPTMVLPGTHGLVYTDYDLQASRSQAIDEWVDAQSTAPQTASRHSHAWRSPPVRLTGPAGGGFLLDTNTIHRGEVRGTKPRTVVPFPRARQSGGLVSAPSRRTPRRKPETPVSQGVRRCAAAALSVRGACGGH